MHQHLHLQQAKTAVEVIKRNKLFEGQSSSLIRQQPKLTTTKKIIYFLLYYIYLAIRYIFPKKIKTVAAFCAIEQKYTDAKKKEFQLFSTYIDRNQNIDSAYYNKENTPLLYSKNETSADKIWRTKMLIENTTRGNIGIYYMPSKQGFAYYSNQNGIPYQLLNAVAMKYVKTFRCFDFFADEQELKNAGKDKSPLDYNTNNILQSNQTKNPSFIAQQKSNAFVKLKPALLHENVQENDNDKYSINTFFYQGKIDKINVLQIPEKKKKNIVFNIFNETQYADLFITDDDINNSGGGGVGNSSQMNWNTYKLMKTK